MRDVTFRQPTADIEVLDQIRSALEEAIRNSYEEIRANNPRFAGHRGDIEIAANLHNRRLSQAEALEEIARTRARAWRRRARGGRAPTFRPNPTA